jgi:two-component system sensor histidine kinase PhoQ
MTLLSIRTRLIGAGALVLVAFLAVAGVALQRAHADSVRAAHFARLQGTVYLLLAGAELDAQGALVMPPDLAEPRLSLPGSGLYASVLQGASGARWQSASALGLSLPFARSAAVGEWRFEEVQGDRGAYLSASYGVRWAGVGGTGVPLVLSVLESRATLDRESQAFSRTLWGWLAGAGVLLLLAQGLLLRWGLKPLRRVAAEIARVESGSQAELQGRYPAELAGLASNLNTLIRQERVRQTRYKEALSFLAHSLKTPLAVLRSALAQPAYLPATVVQQVDRMDHIVQHQLGRAMASGAARFVPHLALAPVAQRVRESLAKVYAGKGVQVVVDCAPDLAWRMDEGDAFELLGNLMDNAVKWARAQVEVRVWQEGTALRLRLDDDGPGFTDTRAVLQLHVRADEKMPGHGVGLAVVNDLVASHGGTLVLGRADLGGARIDVTLPGV